MQAMRERDQRHRLAGTVQVDAAYLGGMHPGGSRRTRQPVQVTDRGQPVLPKLSMLGRFPKVEVEQWTR